MSRISFILGLAVLSFSPIAFSQSDKETRNQLQDLLSKHCFGTVDAREGKIQKVRCRADQLKIEEKVTFDDAGLIQATINTEIVANADSLVTFGRGEREGSYYVRLEDAQVKRRRFDGTRLYRETVDRVDLLFEDATVANEVLRLMSAWIKS